MPYPDGGVTLTDAGGTYQFDDLPPGDYYVVFDASTAPNGDFYTPTAPRVGNDDTIDSDADLAGRTDNTGDLVSGQDFPNLDAGYVCAIAVTVGDPATVCSTQAIDLTGNASITPASLGGFWATDGTGTFLDAGGAPIPGEPFTFGEVVSYAPSADDALRGSVTFTLTTNDPAALEPVSPCEAVSTSVTIEVSKVDCGEFFWDGGN